MKAKTKVGLDIGSDAIKVVEMSDSAEKQSLLNIGIREIKDTARSSVSAIVKALMEESGITTKEVNISVSGAQVIVRFIAMPKMKEEDLKGAVRFEAERFIPFDINDCLTAFQTLRKIESENKIELLLVAAKKGYVEERIKLVEAAGCTVRTVDVDSFALINSFLKNFSSIQNEKTYALLNIGAGQTNLSMIKGGIPCFVRDVVIGGNDFDSAIAKSLNIEPVSAKELKAVPKEKAQEVAVATKPIVNNLMDEMRLCFSYYENQCGRNVDEIYISGGSARLAGLEMAFQESFGIKAVAWDPFQFLEKTTEMAGRNLIDTRKESFAIAMGLALR